MPKSRLTRGLRDQIAIELRKDIVAGRLSPGMQMVERQLAQRFGVSHAPIREALLQLSHEGLLVSQTNRGAQVAPILEPPLRRFFMTIRTTLECHALRLGFGDLDEADFTAWEGMLTGLEAARQAKNAAAIAELDFGFHQSIVCAAGQADIEAAWRTVTTRARLYAQEWLQVAANSTAEQPHHASLVANCRRRDLDGAIRSLEANIQSEMESIAYETPIRVG